MGETTPPPDEACVPEDNFPKVFSMTSNAYTKRGLSKSKPDLSKSRSSLNSEEEENKPPAAKKEKDYDSNSMHDNCNKVHAKEADPKLADVKLPSTPFDSNSDSDQTNHVPSTPLSENKNNVPNSFDAKTLGSKPVCEDVVIDVVNIPNDNDNDLSMNNSEKSSCGKSNENRLDNETESAPKENGIPPDTDEIATPKAKGVRRDLGSITEKLLAKSKIKKLKGKKGTSTKKVVQTPSKPKDAAENDSNISNAKETKIDTTPEASQQKQSEPECDVGKGSLNTENGVKDGVEPSDAETSGGRKATNLSRKRHLEASLENLSKSKTTGIDSQEAKESSLGRDGTHESADVLPTTNTATTANNGGGQIPLNMLYSIPLTKIALITFTHLLLIVFTVYIVVLFLLITFLLL